MNQIAKNTFKKQMMYQGETIVSYEISYPQIRSQNYLQGMRIFNQYNLQIARKLQRYAETELFEQAKETYEYNKKQGYPIMVYELILTFQVTYNKDEIVSLYQDQYTFTGGAHGNTIRTAQNWDLRKAKQIPLQAFYPNNPYYVIDIIKEINGQIAKQNESGSNDYFDNYCQLVLDTFRLDNYYLMPDHLAIFFQQYDIAPYSSGLPVFLIPYQK